MAVPLAAHQLNIQTPAGQLQMQADEPTLLKLRDCLSQTMSPDTATRRAAEGALSASEKQPGFAQCVMRLMEVNSAPDQRPVRQAAAILFKNFIKNNWSEEDGTGDAQVSEADRAAVKQHVVSLMCRMPADVQRQLSEALTTVAKYDFPEKWGDLLPRLKEQLAAAMDPATGDLSVLNGVLTTANAIFKRFRYVYKTDALYAVLAHCLGEFQEPLLQLFQMLYSQRVPAATGAGDKAALSQLFAALRTICRIFFSLNWQDLPEFFEDNMQHWMQGFSRFLGAEGGGVFSLPLLVDADEDEEPGPVEKLQTAIIENLALYADKYEGDPEKQDEFWPFVQGFTQQVWVLLVATGPQPKYDALATTAIKFLTAIVSKEMHKTKFQPAPGDTGTLKQICESIVVPNLLLRESDEELFEDNPIEFIRNDIEGSDTDTRRRAACNLVSGLLRHFKRDVTGLLFNQMNELVTRYKTDPMNNWKSKDSCIALVIALTVEAQTKDNGVSQVNVDVPLLPFYQSEVLPELTHASGVNHLPFVKAGAIKFVSTFRNQLAPGLGGAAAVDAAHFSKLFEVLVQHLAAESSVVHTYAARAIERMLVIKGPPAAPGAPPPPPPFGRAQLQPQLESVFTALFALCEKLLPKENEYVMKAIMRVLHVAGPDLVAHAKMVIERLSAIMGRIAANPTNPSFSHFLFESVAALVDHGCRPNPQNVAGFEHLLFPPFNKVLELNVDALMPYVFQILAQLLELRQGGLGAGFGAMFEPMLKAAVWETRGNVPAAARLISAYLNKGAGEAAVTAKLEGVLGIFQKLLASKANEEYAFAILRSLVTSFELSAFEAYVPTILQLLLARAQTNKTVKYAKHLLRFFSLFAARHGGAALSSRFEALQPGLFLQFFGGMWLQHVQKVCDMGSSARRTAQAGMVRVLCEAPELAANAQAWQQSLKLAVDLCRSDAVGGAGDDGEGVDHIELAEEGYTAGYARLRMARSNVPDPLRDLPAAPIHLVQTLAQFNPAHPGLLTGAAQASPEHGQMLQSWASSAGVPLQM